jgi:hypothetical protein
MVMVMAMVLLIAAQSDQVSMCSSEARQGEP